MRGQEEGEDDRWRGADDRIRIRGLQGRVRRRIGAGAFRDLDRPRRTCPTAGRERTVHGVPVRRVGRTGGPSPARGEDARNNSCPFDQGVGENTLNY